MYWPVNHLECMYGQVCVWNNVGVCIQVNEYMSLYISDCVSTAGCMQANMCVDTGMYVDR